MNSKKTEKNYIYRLLYPIRCPNCGIPSNKVEFPEDGEIPCYNCGNPILKEGVESSS